MLLQGSIPPQLLAEFRRQVTSPKGLTFKPQSQIQELFDLLQTWQSQEKGEKTWWSGLPLISRSPAAIANLVTLGDAWLADAIAKKLIQPLNLSALPGWQRLLPRWQEVVRRDPQGKLDTKGEIWGAPYRWGTTMIAYRRDKFKDLGWTPNDWQDLWKPELRDRISLLDQPREIIGLTLKKLGYSYNSRDLSQISTLKAELMALAKQVKFFSSKYYLQPLVLGDTWLAVGWSSDILPLIARNPKIGAVIPQSGTSLWADLWVKPATQEESEPSFSEKWIDFCWQSQSANKISLFTDAASPIILSLKPDEIAADVRKNPLLLVNQQILDQSEFLDPLPLDILKQYQSLWQAMFSE